MNPVTKFIKRYPQVTFWAIAYLTGNVGYILNRLYPSDFWQFFIWGSFLGGALVTAIADGRLGLKTYFGRLVRWRAGIQWYAVALLAPFLLHLISIGLALLSGAQISPDLQFPSLPQVLFFYLFAWFFIALGEEPGFRGFALPRLLDGRSAFTASLILGVLHAIWHLPLIVGGEEQPMIVLNVISSALLFTWIFNHTNGSVFIAMLLHASSDTAPAFFGSVFSGADAMTARIWLAGVFVMMAVLLRIFTGPELGRKSAPVVEALPVERPAVLK